jgi:2-phosphosulfolactate phosphatase
MNIEIFTMNNDLLPGNKSPLTVEVVFSPVLYPCRLTRENFIVVISDILRASTSMCAAMAYGVGKLIPVADLDEARDYKRRGYLVASERDGMIMDFADFGNSPFNFMTPEVQGKTIAYCTTNGTQAIEMARDAQGIVAGSFVNLTALSQWLMKQEKNVIILCSGWKNKFCLEDSIFAGALSELLLGSGHFKTECDAAQASVDLWHCAKPDLPGYVEKAAHRHRLKKLGLDDVMEYTFTLDSTDVVPGMKNGAIVNLGIIQSDNLI